MQSSKSRGTNPTVFLTGKGPRKILPWQGVFANYPNPWSVWTRMMRMRKLDITLGMLPIMDTGIILNWQIGIPKSWRGITRSNQKTIWDKYRKAAFRSISSSYGKSQRNFSTKTTFDCRRITNKLNTSGTVQIQRFLQTVGLDFITPCCMANVAQTETSNRCQYLTYQSTSFSCDSSQGGA